MKLCRKCGETKPVEEFSKDRSKTDGLNAYCKPCSRAATKATKAKPPKRTPPPGLKWCSGCKQDKPIAEFWRETGTYDGLHQLCKQCGYVRHTNYRKANQAHLNADMRRRYREQRDKFADYGRKKSYGLAYGEYDRMLAAQNGRCAICGTDDPSPRRSFAVDHCHDTGKVRALLCTSCNVGIGNFKHSIDFLESAIKYLQEHSD